MQKKPIRFFCIIFLSDEDTKAYEELTRFVLDHIGEENLAEIKQRLMNTGMYSEEELEKEIVANACAEVLYDSKAIQAMAKENRTLYERVREFIRGLINKIRQVYQQENSFRQESVLMRDVSEELAELWDAALLEKMNGAAETQQNETQFEVRELDDGRKIAWIDEPLTNKQAENFQYVGARLASLVGQSADVLETGERVYIGKDIQHEYLRSKYTQGILNNRDIRRAKFKVAGNLQDVIAVGTNKQTEDATHHHATIRYDSVYRYKTLFAFPMRQSDGLTNAVKAYSATMIVLHGSDGQLYLYDLVSINEQKDTMHALFRAAKLENQPQAQDPSAGSNDTRNSENVNAEISEHQTEFSMREPVEQVGNLLALHNLTEQNLLDTIRLGGFPMPSIAVVKTDTGHSKYGPISVVLSSNSIDPEADSRNHVYGGDAYTPTAPNVEYPVDSKRSQQLEQMLDQQARKVAGGIFGNTSVLRSAGVEDSVNMSAEELANRLADNDTVRAAYLTDQGETLDPVMADKVWNRKFGNDVLNTIIDRIGVQDLAEIVAQLELGNSTETALGEHSETLNDILREYYTRQNEPMLQKMAAVKKWTADEISEKRETRLANSMSKVSQFQLEDLIRNA